MQKAEKEEEHPLNEINNAATEASDLEAANAPNKPTQDSIPWYLQVQQPIAQQESPLAARQRLPELPGYPPKILQRLLEHVSIELGMDDLSLLDLRPLDPAHQRSAVNLIMIIGTRQIG